VKYGKWLAEPRRSAGFEEPMKIVVRQTGDSLIAAMDTKQFITMDNLYTIRQQSNSCSLYCLLAFLNSSVLRWYYQTVLNPERGEALAQVKKGHLVMLPIPVTKNSTSRLICNITNFIQFIKTDDENCSVAAAFFESLIDSMVYELYFPDEIKAVGCEVLKHLTNLPEIRNDWGDEKKLAIIETVHKELSSAKHPVSIAMLKMKTVPEVRIIEGLDK
jgi:hypothetical protein